MNKLHIQERICTPCSERVRKCVRWCTQHLYNVPTCTCMVLTTPIEMHAYSPQKMHMHSCMRATVQKLLCHGSSCELILSLAQASCRLSFAARPAAASTKSVARRCSFKKSIQIHAAHDAVAAAVSHKYHSIIRVGADLIQFFYGSHSKRVHWAHPSQKSISTTFFAGFHHFFRR